MIRTQKFDCSSAELAVAGPQPSGCAMAKYSEVRYTAFPQDREEASWHRIIEQSSQGILLLFGKRGKASYLPPPLPLLRLRDGGEPGHCRLRRKNRAASLTIKIRFCVSSESIGFSFEGYSDIPRCFTQKTPRCISQT